MNRQSLQRIAQDTLSKVNRGYYYVSGRRINLEPFETGKLYTPEYIENIDLKGVNTYENPKIILVFEKTVDTIFRYKNEKLGVLNFASAYNPGGGFLNGSMAQEESLAYCSNLYETIKDNEFYALNKGVRTKMYSDNMIVSNVEFFKNSNYSCVLQPKQVTVITSAAVNMGEIIKRKENIQLAKLTMKNRMRKVLKLFANEGCETMILGGFGCGVFRNNPEDIANYWVDLLIDEGYMKYFKTIIFSVYDSKVEKGKKSNYRVFQEIMKSRDVL